MRKGPSVVSVGWLLLAGCSSFTSPPETEVEPTLVVPAATVHEMPIRPAASAAPAPPPPAPPQPQVRASHILIAYKGAQGAAPKVARTKEQAKRRAEEVLKKARTGGDFAALAKQYSDDPGSGPRGGDLGAFTRAQMVKPFSDAAFALQTGQLSDVVESEFGFHIIKRMP
jgi:parvulin-like peptidyl-prolyl isomerase